MRYDRIGSQGLANNDATRPSASLPSRHVPRLCSLDICRSHLVTEDQSKTDAIMDGCDGPLPPTSSQSLARDPTPLVTMPGHIPSRHAMRCCDINSSIGRGWILFTYGTGSEASRLEGCHLLAPLRLLTGVSQPGPTPSRSSFCYVLLCERRASA